MTKEGESDEGTGQQWPLDSFCSRDEVENIGVKELPGSITHLKRSLVMCMT